MTRASHRSVARERSIETMTSKWLSFILFQCTVCWWRLRCRCYFDSALDSVTCPSPHSSLTEQWRLTECVATPSSQELLVDFSTPRPPCDSLANRVTIFPMMNTIRSYYALLIVLNRLPRVDIYRLRSSRLEPR
jgi:hypothetical protein